MIKNSVALMALSIFAFLATHSSLHAEIIFLNPTGAAGAGLLGGNISPPPSQSGTGGVGPTGVFFDTVTNILHVDVHWGSGNGFTDLTSTVEMLHLHGPTEDQAPGNFGQQGPLIINLGQSATFNNSPVNGGVNDNFFLSNQEAEWLLNNQTYINVHTTVNLTSGEIRGYLVAVPEPNSVWIIAMLGVACIGFVGLRRDRSRPIMQKVLSK